MNEFQKRMDLNRRNKERHNKALEIVKENLDKNYKTKFCFSCSNLKIIEEPMSSKPTGLVCHCRLNWKTIAVKEWNKEYQNNSEFIIPKECPYQLEYLLANDKT